MFGRCTQNGNHHAQRELYASRQPTAIDRTLSFALGQDDRDRTTAISWDVAPTLQLTARTEHGARVGKIPALMCGKQPQRQHTHTQSVTRVETVPMCVCGGVFLSGKQK